MNPIVAVLTLLLATQNATVKPDPAVQKEIATFVGHLQANRPPMAFAAMSTSAKQQVGLAQLDAYLASRRRVLGAITGVTNIRHSTAVEVEHGMTMYEADVRFEKGTAPSWFVLTRESDAWRVHGFGLNMPEGKPAIHGDAGELAPIAHEIMTLMKTSGAPAISSRFSTKDLASVNQTPEMVRGAMEMHDAILGRMQSYTLGVPEDAPDQDDAVCRKVQGEGKFAYGTAPITLLFCWDDGFWRLRHALISPQMNPVMLERSLEWALKGNVKAKCPANAPFPVGGTIVCRLTPQNEPAQDATILRKSATGWEIVGLTPVKK